MVSSSILARDSAAQNGPPVLSLYSRASGPRAYVLRSRCEGSTREMASRMLLVSEEPYDSAGCSSRSR